MNSTAGNFVICLMGVVIKCSSKAENKKSTSKPEPQHSKGPYFNMEDITWGFIPTLVKEQKQNKLTPSNPEISVSSLLFPSWLGSQTNGNLDLFEAHTINKNIF